ncbi:MAG TPA: hypothetical protein VH188_03930 [Chthoniobacterales bacterium]|nr:hypothetical protein [Chthoniobacterales bacterium]
MDKLAVPPAWKALADAKTAELKKQHIFSRVARNKFIDDNDRVWRDARIKAALLAVSHGKCWFTEARDKASDFHVEHFRPKKEAWDLDGTKRDGYWWRSFDPTNYRISGAVINRPKACYFPLRPGSAVGTPERPRCRDERPVFLDPTIIWDVGLVNFDAEGKLIPRETANLDDQHRVVITVEKFRLNEHQPLIEWRENTWQECSDLISGILSDQNDIEAGDGVARAEGERDQKLQRLKVLTDEHTEFAGVARAAVMKLFPSLAPTLFSA